jgi:LAO/AO transport system kinase
MPSFSRLITGLENEEPGVDSIRPLLREASGGAHVVAVTGPPGSGKSTLIDALIGEWRRQERRVAVVCVDPSSLRSGGAILGDRVRMEEHTLDPGVFVRSMSNRGCLGGIGRATADAVSVLDASGWDVVVVEPVGAGQADVEVVDIAQTTVVVSVPGLGDDVQTLKAGLLEIADLHVVNKADLAGAERTAADLSAMLTLGAEAANGWAPPVLQTASRERAGIGELAEAIDAHRAWLRTSGRLDQVKPAGTLATDAAAAALAHLSSKEER